MRQLFEIDLKDYDPNGTVGVRSSMRGIIIKDGRLAMIHSLKYDYYKLPGGGAEQGEDNITALIREVAEESGLHVASGSVREYGFVRRIQKGKTEDIFIQENYYYLCDVTDISGKPSLDDYEAEEGFALEYVTPSHAIAVNRENSHGEKSGELNFEIMLDREIRVLEIIRTELF